MISLVMAILYKNKSAPEYISFSLTATHRVASFTRPVSWLRNTLLLAISCGIVCKSETRRTANSAYLPGNCVCHLFSVNCSCYSSILQDVIHFFVGAINFFDNYCQRYIYHTLTIIVCPIDM